MSGRLLLHPAVQLGLRLGAILGVYGILDRWVLGLGRLPVEVYSGPSVIQGLVSHAVLPPGDPSLGFWARLGVSVVLGAILILRRDRLLAPWSEMESGSVLRVVVGVATLLLAWTYATYDYNAFFDQSHFLDRLALGALGILTLWRPVFGLPLAVLIPAMAGQFQEPIGGYSVAEPFMLLRVLLLFAGYGIVRVFWRQVKPSDLVFLVITLLASGYVASGLGKLRMGWFLHGKVALLLPSAYGSGWLAFLSPEVVADVTRQLLRIDVLMVAGTFAVEILAVGALVRRSGLLVFLPLWMVFHLAVLSLSGIFFWRWMVFEATLLLLLLRPGSAFAVFTRAHAVWSIPLILGGTVWFHPVNLSWYSVPHSYAYRFEATGVSGRSYSLSSSYFAPYDYQFALNGFHYLSPFPQLRGQWGWGSSGVQAAEVAALRSTSELEALVRERGQVFENEERAARMDTFVRRFVATRNVRGPEGWTTWLRAPPLVVRLPGTDPYGFQEPIVRVVVRQVTVFFDGRTYEEVEPRVVRTIEIPMGP